MPKRQSATMKNEVSNSQHTGADDAAIRHLFKKSELWVIGSQKFIHRRMPLGETHPQRICIVVDILQPLSPVLLAKWTIFYQYPIRKVKIDTTKTCPCDTFYCKNGVSFSSKMCRGAANSKLIYKPSFPVACCWRIRSERNYPEVLGSKHGVNNFNYFVC